MKNTGFALPLLLAFLAACGPDFDDVKNLDSDGETVVCFGNSITRGEGAEKGEDYPSLLNAALDREIINAGVNGDTAASALRRLERDVLSKNPAVVIVGLGGNDFLRSIPKSETRKNLSEIIIRIHEQGAAVMLLGMKLGMFTDEYEGIYEELAEETGAYLIPKINKGITDEREYKSDMIHPNAAGYRLMAERILDHLVSLLEEMEKRKI